MQGWSAEPCVRTLLDEFSRLNGVRLLAVENDPGSMPRPDPAGYGARRQVVVGQEPVGWVVVQGTNGADARGEEIAQRAAGALSAQVMALREIESLSEEVAATYEELNLLYGLGETLGELREEDDICRAVLDQAQRVIGGERGAVFVYDAPGQVLHAAATRNLSEAAEGVESLPRGAGVLGWVADSGRPLLADDLDRIPPEVPRDSAGLTADHLLLAAPMLCAPLRARSEVLGVVALFAKAFGRPFTSQDLKLLQTLAGTAAVFIQISRFIGQARQAERLQKELEIARSIQQALLPRREPAITGIDLAGLCRPASMVGGDYYGYLDEAVAGATGLAIMDVSGHSVGAAVCMASIRSMLRCEAWSRRSTREVIERVNDLASRDLEEGSMYATLVYALYEHATGDLRYTNAGHPPPLLLKAGEQRCRRLGMGGMGIGIRAQQSYREETVRLTSGDLLVFYTDGLTEARAPGGEMFGEARLGQLLDKYRQVGAWEALMALIGEVESFCGGAPQSDDLALVVMKAVPTGRAGAGGGR